MITLLATVFTGIAFNPQFAPAADSTVTNCTRDGLVSAIAASTNGTVTFDCPTNTIDFAAGEVI